MILLPAIDILDGQAVRLARGDFAKRSDYDPDPLEAARRWVADGAQALHVVDLDGARSGQPVNLAQVERIARAVTVPLQVGGGLRTLASLRSVRESGAASMIIGTAAFRDPDFLAAAAESFGPQLIVSVDVRAGRVAAGGWLEDTSLSASEALRSLQAAGISRFVYSSIERDGMLSGPDIDGATAFAAELSGSFTYSGGIGGLADLVALAGMGEPKLQGVIAGKAIYERRFSVGEAQALLDTLAGGC
ncbi:MAG: HisA/HisF-related TIM barrel protein [Actinomycetota bacterium]|nr:HisA/HisF-related TIM barrel protein [Actinomycetota bacterium]